MNRNLAKAARLSACIAFGAAGLALAGPASAQSDFTDGVTVYGRHHVPDDVDELSQRVSYADLDLRTREGVDELNWRVRQAARQLCEDLGEAPDGAQNRSVLPSCEGAARDRAWTQIRTAVRAARYGEGYYRSGYYGRYGR